MRIERCRRRLTDFGRAVYPHFVTPRHILKLAETLEAVERGDIKRLMVTMPPRHGKSTTTSHLFPAWYLGRNPNRRVIACSYSVDLAWEFSRKARNTVTSPEYVAIFPEVGLAPDARAVGQWELCNPQNLDAHGQPARYQGGYVSAGVGGGITGKGSDLFLIDDVLKSAEEAKSATVLQNIWEWYTSTAYTRLEGEAALVLIMTRWAEGDLAGRLVQAMGDAEADQWTILNLPAFAETDDALGREIDEALWPEKFDAEELSRIRVNVGSRDFTSLYQQRPAPIGGSIFKREWWRRYRLFDRSQAESVIQVWDTAFQPKQTADYSVCATWALMPQGAYLVDLFRDRIGYPDLERKAEDLAAKWNPNAVLIEKKASGQSLIQSLERRTRLPVIGIDVAAHDSKEVRAHSVSAFVEAGKAYLPESAPWVDDFVEEHASFPNGAHDDMVDTTSMALRRLLLGDGQSHPYSYLRDDPAVQAILRGLT